MNELIDQHDYIKMTSTEMWLVDEKMKSGGYDLKARYTVTGAECYVITFPEGDRYTIEPSCNVRTINKLP